MPLTPIPRLFAAALAGRYSLGYFESWNLESLQGVIDAAEQTRSPVIIGFNGEFMTGPDRLAGDRIEWYGAIGRRAAELASVPCGVTFNECPSDVHVWQAVMSGFNLVMLEDPAAPHEEMTRRIARLVPFAHAHGVAVEAELGELPNASSGIVEEAHASTTDPVQAAWFVRETGVDLLSVSVGNVHVLAQGERELDLDLLAELHRRTGTPLGLHGGTGIALASLKEAVRLGVTKVAFGTYLKQRYLAAVRTALGSDVKNPHKLLGMGGPEDVLVAGRRAVCEAVLERMEVLGCFGRAST